MFKRLVSCAALGLVAAASPADAQQAPPAEAAVTVCGSQVVPRAAPPANSGPVVLFIAPCFEAQGNASLVDIQTYLYYIQIKASRPSEGVWIPYDDTTEKTVLEDFKRLWGTKFLDNLWVD